MVDMQVLKALAVIAVAGLLLKRAVKGPQKRFARLACLGVGVGAIALAGASQQGDVASWIGAILITAGLIIAVAMVLADMQWSANRSFALWRKHD